MERTMCYVHLMMYWLNTKYHKIIVTLTFNLMKCLWWTLGLGILDMNKNATYWMSENIASNQSSFHKLCIKDHFQSVRVCSLPCSLKYTGNSKSHRRMLAFRMSNTDMRVFLSTHQMSLPNASVSYRGGSHYDIPVYREDVSKNLHIFYEGSLVLLGLTLPFSAEWNGVQFAGRTYFHKFDFKLICAISESTFYMRDHCFYCMTNCESAKLMQIYNHTLHDHRDFMETDVEYPDFDYSQTYSFKRRSYKKRRHAAAFPPTPLSCVLHLVADHLFFKYIADGRVIKALNVLFSVVNGADAIFRSTDFDGDGQGDNIGFIIGKVTVFSDIQDPDYILTHPFLVANDYLNIFSHYDFDDYCLGLAFTYRDFDGLGGSAFQANSDESLPGGVCQKRLKHNFLMVSYNTAVITLLNYGRRLEMRRVVLILAHEMGHAFGARHDVTTECLPKSGHFLMSATIQFGNLPNNARFSSCSIRSMLPVIKKKGSCLVSSNQMSRCGNTIPEIGEECDCGTSNICHLVDPCCTPADVEENEDIPCTVRRSLGKLCSPRVNPCCTKSCTFIPSSDRKVCNQLYDCSYPSFCDGLSSHCPFSGYLINGTLCNNGFQVCIGGTCSQGVCEYYNLTNCACADHENRCKLCCRDPWTQACQPASGYGISNISGEIQYGPGEQCYNSGFCDLSLECQGMANIVLTTNSVLGFRTLAEFERYVRNYWLYYIFAAFCVVFTVTVTLLPYHFTDNNYMKTLRYGKILAVFATGEYQTKIYRQTLIDIDNHYTHVILRLHGECEPMDIIEALGRLKLFFPEVHTEYLSRVAKLSASESTAIKILLLQGFKMRTFTKSKVTSQ